jgi:Ca2+-binding RTX toxin-like protein
VRATDAGGLSVDVPLAVTAVPVNDAPTTAGLPAVSVAEDAAPTAVALTSRFADPEDGAAGLTYSIVGNTNPALFASASISGGALTLGYVPDVSGSATLRVRATDGGGLWVESDLAVTVAPVNDAPTFVAGSSVTVPSDAGPQTVTGWATTMSRGPADEAGQALSFEVTTDSPLMFAVQPGIDPATGTLTFTPIAGVSGTATVTVVLRDNGGGTDASAPATFAITLTTSALPPGVQVIGTELVITGGSGADSITVSTISGGNGSNGAKITGTINGQSVNKTFRQTLTRVRVNADGGNDTVNFANSWSVPTVVVAGAGDDSVRGGAGADLILGGDGQDNLQGYNGDDDVDGGAGDDSITGGLGRDVLWGGTGNDTIQGGDGNDFLIGGLGADELYGQNDHDIVVGGSAATRNPADSLRTVLTDWDPLVTGIYVDLRARLAVSDDPASSDRLQGDADTDWFWSWDLTDVLDLGPGEQRN